MEHFDVIEQLHLGVAAAVEAVKRIKGVARRSLRRVQDHLRLRLRGGRDSQLSSQVLRNAFCRTATAAKRHPAIPDLTAIAHAAEP